MRKGFLPGLRRVKHVAPERGKVRVLAVKCRRLHQAKALSNACGALLPHVSERDKLREAFGAGREAANKDARRIVKEGRVAIRERCLPLPTCVPGWDVYHCPHLHRD